MRANSDLVTWSYGQFARLSVRPISVDHNIYRGVIVHGPPSSWYLHGVPKRFQTVRVSDCIYII
jgi:hypothetical protein